MSVERIKPHESNDGKVNEALELERKRALQGDETRASQDLAARQAQQVKPTSGEERTTEAVSSAHKQQDRGAEWQKMADRTEKTVPVSVSELAAQDADKKVEKGTDAQSSAREDANRETQKRDIEKRLTIAEIQAEMTKKSGIIRG